MDSNLSDFVKFLPKLGILCPYHFQGFHEYKLSLITSLISANSSSFLVRFWKVKKICSYILQCSVHVMVLNCWAPEDPHFPDEDTCIISRRYRTRPACYDFNPNVRQLSTIFSTLSLPISQHVTEWPYMSSVVDSGPLLLVQYTGDISISLLMLALKTRRGSSQSLS